MTIEHARAHTVPKSWGVVDLRPWSNARHDDGAIGEIWYERSGKATTDSSLLLKLLFTNQPLSIQVHPDDAFAHSMGLPNGKTEAWYVLSAVPEARVALGLRRGMSLQEFRSVVDDGSISNLVAWRAVTAGDVIFVPAGTIHAIGAGVVIAEIQQHSDATFRLFDYGRQRELHVENAVAVANIGPAESQVLPTRLTHERTLLVSSPHFVFERIDLAPNSTWSLDAVRETWLLIVDGDAHAGSFEVTKGDAIFAQSDYVDLHVGKAGMTGLAAYTGGNPVSNLLRNLEPQSAINAEQKTEGQLPKFQSREQPWTHTTAGRQQK
jgi:mannose-6-phosphate isomerase